MVPKDPEISKFRTSESTKLSKIPPNTQKNKSEVISTDHANMMMRIHVHVHP